MPLVKNTETGTNYLEKINTEADTRTRTAIRSFDKIDGSSGTSGNTVYTLPFMYVPDSHTLFVYVNGQKAEYKATGGSTTEQLLEYAETDNQTVTFYYGLEDDDVVEFFVIGGYGGEVNDELVQDLTQYKTIHGSGTVGGVLATTFSSNQPMGGYKFTNMGNGTTAGDSIGYSQLVNNTYGSYQNASTAFSQYHTTLFNTAGTSPVVTTASGDVDVVNNKIIQLADPTISTDGANKGYVDGVLYDSATYTDFAGTNCSVSDQYLYNKGADRVSVYTGQVTVASSASIASFDVPFDVDNIIGVEISQSFDGLSVPTFANSAIMTSQVSTTGTVTVASSVNGAIFNYAVHLKAV